MRSDFLTAHLASSKWAVCPSYASAVFEAINNGALDAKAEPFRGDISSVMAYEKISNVAVITVRGAMDTRLAEMNAMCGGVANYEAINQMVDKAEADTSVDTILYRVDSNGGNVAGAEVTANKINGSKKRTAVLYENAGYSAAIMVFAGVKERYASSKLTGLGSIGVITGYKKEDDGKIELIRSSNAPNKVCDPSNKDCRSRIQASVDEAENEFISRVASYTGWSMHEVIANFDNGGTISAAKALQIGFISRITDYDTILASLTTKKGDRSMDESLEPKIGAFDFSAQYAAVIQENAQLKATMDAMIGVAVMSQNLPTDSFKAAMEFARNGDIKGAHETIVSAKASNGSTGQREMFGENKKPETPKVDFAALAAIATNIQGGLDVL